MVDVCIAVGHGRRSDGTFDPGTTDGPHNEQRDAVPVARACTVRLRDRYGLDVESEHEQDDDPNWPGTRDWANRLGCLVCVSFHFDYKLAPLGAFSIQTSDEGRKLGWAIESAVEAAGWEIRDYPDDRDNLGLLNGTHMPCVIFECGRIGSDPIDEEHEQETMGRAAADGIADYLGVKPKNEGLTVSEYGKITTHLNRIERKVERTAGDVWDDPLPHASVPNKKPAWRWLNLALKNVRDAAGLDRDDVRVVLNAQGLTPDLIRKAVADAGAEVNGDAVVDALVERLAA